LKTKRRFRGTYRPFLQNRSRSQEGKQHETLELEQMDAISSSETSVDINGLQGVLSQLMELATTAARTLIPAADMLSDQHYAPISDDFIQTDTFKQIA
jgi:hypothetical protein